MIQHRTLNTIVLVLLAASVILLGFFREYVFVNINEHLGALWYERPSRISGIVKVVEGLDYWQLYNLKWLLTAAFTIVFFSWTLVILKIIFDQWYWKELAALYVILIVLSTLIMLLAWPLRKLDEAYIIARFLMGIAQSPIPLMLMVPGIILRNRTNS